MERRLFVLALALCGVGLANAVEARQTQAPPFRVDLPSGFVAKARPRGMDFDLYDVIKGDVAYVGVYAGNFADFPMDKASKVSKGSVPDIQVAERRRPDGSVRREYLIRTHARWPAVLHVWPQDVPGDQALADHIAASVRAK